MDTRRNRVTLTARDIMERHWAHLTPEQDIQSAAKLLYKEGLSSLPVHGADGTLVGMLSEYDCLQLIVDSTFFQEAGAFMNTVEDLMTEVQYSARPDTPLCEICCDFRRSHVRRMPVLDQGKMVGIISRREVLKTLATL